MARIGAPIGRELDLEALLLPQALEQGSTIVRDGALLQEQPNQEASSLPLWRPAKQEGQPVEAQNLHHTSWTRSFSTPARGPAGRTGGQQLGAFVRFSARFRMGAPSLARPLHPFSFIHGRRSPARICASFDPVGRPG